MADKPIHENEQEFEDFIEQELNGLAERAQEQHICVDCLSDRMIVELVAGMARSGVRASDILGMVAEGLSAAEADAATESAERPSRMH